MLRLLKDVRPGNPTIGLRWCLDQEDRDKLKGFEAQSLYVLIVVAYGSSRKEDRYLIPVDQFMTYVGFAYPGTHRVFARLVFASKQVLPSMRKFFLEHLNRHSYKNEVLEYHRDGLPSGHYGVAAVDGEEFQVE